MGGYTVGEVVFLLSLKEWQALQEDARFRSCLAQVTPDGELAPSTQVELDPVPTYARWHEVQRARTRVEQSKERVVRAAEEALVLDMHIRGFSEREIADVLGVSQPTAHRRWRARLAEIIEELGGVLDPEERLSTVPACMRCGSRPRARLAATRRRVRGGWKLLTPERLSSLCRECTPVERLELLIAARGAVNQDGG